MEHATFSPVSIYKGKIWFFTNWIHLMRYKSVLFIFLKKSKQLDLFSHITWLSFWLASGKGKWYGTQCGLKAEKVMYESHGMKVRCDQLYCRQRHLDSLLAQANIYHSKNTVLWMVLIVLLYRWLKQRSRYLYYDMMSISYCLAMFIILIYSSKWLWMGDLVKDMYPNSLYPILKLQILSSTRYITNDKIIQFYISCMQSSLHLFQSSIFHLHGSFHL